MHPSALDLFGEVVVTHADVAAWLRAVPRMDPASPRAAWYVKHWRVVDKIRAAKLRGEWERIEAADAPPPMWWERFSWTRPIVGAAPTDA